ncbi:MAG: cyclase family protein [Bdellovibrionales bacterium]|nr:cyclase family protein [Bdellovibrionales bacterium]
MRMIDLTYDIDGFLFPGNPECKPDGPHNRVGGMNPEFVYDLKICTQSGTHVQGPHYFLKDGATLDKIPLERWCGRAVVIDMPKRGVDTTAEELRSLVEPEEISDSILVLRTGHMEEILETKRLVPGRRPDCHSMPLNS